MRELRTEVDIKAPPEQVWAVLSDFPRHSEWNPFIRSIAGDLKAGSRLDVSIKPPGGKAMSFKPTLLKVQPNVELRWLGRVLLPGVFDGEHIFELNAIEDGSSTRLTHREEFRGVLVPFLWKSLNTNTRQGFEDMNKVLKELVES